MCVNKCACDYRPERVHFLYLFILLYAEMSHDCLSLSNSSDYLEILQCGDDMFKCARKPFINHVKQMTGKCDIDLQIIS